MNVSVTKARKLPDTFSHKRPVRPCSIKCTLGSKFWGRRNDSRNADRGRPGGSGVEGGQAGLGSPSREQRGLANAPASEDEDELRSRSGQECVQLGQLLFPIDKVGHGRLLNAKQKMIV